MIIPQEQPSTLFDHRDADEIFSYLYSFLLFRRKIQIKSFDEHSFGRVSAHVQAEMDVWVGSKDPRALKPSHPSHQYQFSQKINNSYWHFQPSGSTFFSIRFESERFGLESLCAEIDLGESRESPAKIGNIYSSENFIDFVISRDIKNQRLRMLSLKGTGVRALLYPKSNTANWDIVPIPDLSLGFDERYMNHTSYQKTSLKKFLGDLDNI